MENISTEYFMSDVNDHNMQVGAEGEYSWEEFILLGFDVVALFPT